MAIAILQTEEYEKWFETLRDIQARARIDIRIRRLSLGNPGDVRPVGSGVSELRVDYGPGYRIYFISRGAITVILLGVEIKALNSRTLHALSNWPEIYEKNQIKNNKMGFGGIPENP